MFQTYIILTYNGKEDTGSAAWMHAHAWSIGLNLVRWLSVTVVNRYAQLSDLQAKADSRGATDVLSFTLTRSVSCHVLSDSIHFFQRFHRLEGPIKCDLSPKLLLCRIFLRGVQVLPVVLLCVWDPAPTTTTTTTTAATPAHLWPS